MEGEDITMDHGSWILELVDMALGQRIKPPSFDLNAKPLDYLHVDERPPTHYEIGRYLTSCSIAG